MAIVAKKKTNIKKMRKVFGVMSLIAKIIFLPILIFSCMVVITFTTTKDNYHVPSAFGYSIVTLKEGGTEQTVYTQYKNPATIARGAKVVFFNVTNADPENLQYTIEMREFQSLEYNEGREDVRLDGAEFLIPAGNIIGVQTQTIPAIPNLFISNFSNSTSMLLAAILPIVVLALVFIFDTVLYFKDKQESNRSLLYQTEVRPENLTPQEEQNISNFEAIKTSLLSANKKEEAESTSSALPQKPSFESKTIYPSEVQKTLPPKKSLHIKPTPQQPARTNVENVVKPKPPIMPKKAKGEAPTKPPALPPKKPD